MTHKKIGAMAFWTIRRSCTPTASSPACVVLFVSMSAPESVLSDKLAADTHLLVAGDEALRTLAKQATKSLYDRGAYSVADLRCG